MYVCVYSGLYLKCRSLTFQTFIIYWYIVWHSTTFKTFPFLYYMIFSASVATTATFYRSGMNTPSHAVAILETLLFFSHTSCWNKCNDSAVNVANTFENSKVIIYSSGWYHSIHTLFFKRHLFFWRMQTTSFH